MRTKSLSLACILLLLTTAAGRSLAQESQEGEKKTQTSQSDDAAKQTEKARQAELKKKALALIEQIIKDTPNLRLPESRIRLQALTGDTLWDSDQKRARLLFKQATDGLAELQRTEPFPLPESAGLDNTIAAGPELVQSQVAFQSRLQLRQEVLNIITQHDARMAIDFLKATKIGAPDSGRPNSSNDYTERYLEINVATQIADSEPQEALKIAEKSLQAGFSYELAGLVSRMAAKDKDSAAKLASEILDKLRAVDLTTSPLGCAVALSLFRTAVGRPENSEDQGDTQSKPLFDESIPRDLMEMMASAALKASATPPSSAQDEEGEDDDSETPQLVAALRQMLPDVQRYAPARYEALKMKFDEAEKSASPQERANQEFQKLAATGTSAQLIEAAEKAPPEQKDMLYMRAVSKALEEGDADRARQICTEHISDPGRQKMLLGQLNQQSFWKSAEQGKLDEARAMLARMSPNQRAGSLINFASQALSKGDKKQAQLLLEEARGTLGAAPSDFEQMGYTLTMVSLYSQMDPATSFQLLDGMIEQLNSLLSALQAIDGFEYGRHFRDGEILNQSSSQIINSSFQCANSLSALARIDFERAKGCGERFQRTELRLTALLAVAQGILKRPAANHAGPQRFATSFVTNG